MRKVFARWIPALGSSIAETLALKILSRYTTAPRKFVFDVFRNEGTTQPDLGAGYRLEFWNLQEADGSAENVPIQVTRLLPGPASIKVDAEEMLFTAAEVDLNDRQILIDFNINNINLKDIHDTLFPELDVGQSVTFTIAEGVIVGSTSTALPACDVGTWTGSPDLNLIVIGRIQGKGGDGGDDGDPGSDGGPALYTREAINLTDTNGEIWGGGGGGGAGGGSKGGGGGAGQTPGVGGSSAVGAGGAAGTTEAGGLGRDSPTNPHGGDGGGPGLVGGFGTLSSGAQAGDNVGGDPGLAIDGISFVTTIGGAGDRRGGTAN